MSKPSDCISVKQAKALQATWMAAHEIGESGSEGEDNQVCCVTFNIDQLQEYLNYVKEQSQEQGIVAPGIRVYFGAYDVGASDDDGASTNLVDDDDNSNPRTTVFFCASENDGADSGTNYGIDPLNNGNSGWPPNAF